MGDSKVTVWLRDKEAEVAVERHMAMDIRREESRLGAEEQSNLISHHSTLTVSPAHTHIHHTGYDIRACG